MAGTIDPRVLKELEARVAICRKSVETLEEMERNGSPDPRLPHSLEVYRGQLFRLERRLAAYQEGNIIISLKTAVIFPRAPKLGA